MNQNEILIDKDELEKIAFVNETNVLKKIDIGRLPFLNINIHFSDDIWDFGNYTPEMGAYKNRYDFKNIHFEYRKYVKQYILNSIINFNKVSTIAKNFSCLKQIVNFLEINNIYKGIFISVELIYKFNEFLKINLKTENERIRRRGLFIILLTNIECDLKIDFSNLKKLLSKNDTALNKAQIEVGKTPPIPDEIFDKIIDCCSKEILRHDISVDEKMDACAVMLLSQIGLRRMELNLLESNSKKSIKCFNGVKSLSYLEFKTFKTVRKGDSVITETFLTELAELAYDTLEDLTKKRRDINDVNYLFVTSNGTLMDSSILKNRISQFIVKNSKELGLFNVNVEGLKIVTKSYNEKYRKIHPKYFMHFNENDFVSVPNPHQFRVTVCNKLVNQGIEIGWIMEHMNHLTPEMTMHYIRDSKESVKKKSKEFFKGLISGQYNLIGEEVEFLINKIDEFIKLNNYKIKDNLDVILNELANQIPVREKREGYCIKSAFGKKCKYNEFMCAYDMCPNHCTSYLFIDITYERFKNHIKVINYNEMNNYINEAKLESNKLKRMVNKYLIKELEELEYEIKKQGKEQIVKNHNNLLNIINNLDKIYEEVKEWMMN